MDFTELVNKRYKEWIEKKEFDITLEAILETAFMTGYVKGAEDTMKMSQDMLKEVKEEWLKEVVSQII